LLPSVEQAAGLAEHCRHARFVWNLAVEQQRHWQPGRHAPGYNEQCAQLTAARAEYDWLAAGSQTVQQQALRDFAQAMRNFFHGTHRRPTWRKAGKHEGFRQVGLKPRHIKRLSRRYGQVWIPKVGWVRVRWTRAIADTVKSYRVTLDRAGRWHIAFAVIPDPIAGPGDGSVVGVDRGVAISVALSSGELLRVAGLHDGEKPGGCADCIGVWPARSADLLGAHERSGPLPSCVPVKQIAAVTGSKRPPPIWRAVSTPSVSRI
jgi:putative transposase